MSIMILFPRVGSWGQAGPDESLDAVFLMPHSTPISINNTRINENQISSYLFNIYYVSGTTLYSQALSSLGLAKTLWIRKLLLLPWQMGRLSHREVSLLKGTASK